MLTILFDKLYTLLWVSGFVKIITLIKITFMLSMLISISQSWDFYLSNAFKILSGSAHNIIF